MKFQNINLSTKNIKHFSQEVRKTRAGRLRDSISCRGKNGTLILADIPGKLNRSAEYFEDILNIKDCITQRIQKD